MSAIDKATDPHKATEEHYDQQRRPGGANPPKNDIGPNSGTHDGKAPPKPDYDRSRKR